MNNQDYEKARQECWDALHKELLKDEVQWQPVSRKEIVNFVFDRAYALGKQTETITQEDIENEAVDYAFGENKKRPDARPDTAPEYMCEDLIDAFKAGANFALGKQEKDAEDGSLWSRLTDDEKREMQCRYHTNECVLRDHRKRTGDKAQSKAVARMKLLENLFGKENLKNEKK